MRKSFLAVMCLAFSSLLTAQQVLNNEGVIKMVKAGLSEEVIAAAVSSAPGTYDTSTEALVALKAGGASDKIVAAILIKVSVPPTTSPAASTSLALPAGIDEVGVYYKDKSGNWAELMPEVVNFKSGGAMKKFATYGIVKNDINGHIEGKTAKTQVSLCRHGHLHVRCFGLRKDQDSKAFRTGRTRDYGCKQRVYKRRHSSIQCTRGLVDRCGHV